MDFIKHVQEGQLRSDMPAFRPGDTVRVMVKIVEDSGSGEMKERARPQAFEGIVIRKHNAGLSSTFTVRKISYGVGVERVFPMHSPRIDKVEVLDRGRVRRAKLFFLRKLRGKSARIKSLSRI
jgi:large subunit ribosomal protein L19